MLSLLALLGKLETEEERSAVAYLYEKYRNLLTRGWRRTSPIKRLSM